MTDARFLSPSSGYTGILDTIISRGEMVPSRAGETLELENFSCLFMDSTLAVQPKRPGFSPLLGFMEGVQLIGQFSRPALMDHLWPKYAKYTDHYGDYGDRLAYGNQINYVVTTLKNDPDSRRAMLVLWNGVLDTDPGHLDHPCTINIAFRIRKNKLNMSVIMRSNDIWRGSSSDFIQFSLLHQTVAALVGVEAGTYHHTAQSMHLYTSDLELASQWLNENPTSRYETLGAVAPIYNDGWEYSDVVDECKRILTAGAKPSLAQTTMGREIATARFARQGKLDDGKP